MNPFNKVENFKGTMEQVKITVQDFDQNTIDAKEGELYVVHDTCRVGKKQEVVNDSFRLARGDGTSQKIPSKYTIQVQGKTLDCSVSIGRVRTTTSIAKIYGDMATGN